MFASVWVVNKRLLAVSGSLQADHHAITDKRVVANPFDRRDVANQNLAALFRGRIAAITKTTPERTAAVKTQPTPASAMSARFRARLEAEQPLQSSNHGVWPVDGICNYAFPL